jgi:hypothetical protein
MDVETAKAIQGLARMIDNVNERNALGLLALNSVMILLAANRRQGILNEVEVDLINQSFADVKTDEALQRYEKVRALYDMAFHLWNAAEPN